jgi:hypothetical protein
MCRDRVFLGLTQGWAHPYQAAAHQVAVRALPSPGSGSPNCTSFAKEYAAHTASTSFVTMSKYWIRMISILRSTTIR